MSRGDRVLVVCLPGGVLSEKAKELGARVFNINPWSDIGFISFFKVLFILRKHSIEIVDINSPKFYWIGVYAAKILGMKTMITRNVPYRKKSIKRLLNRFFLYSRCDAVISLSEKIKSELVSDYNIDNITVIYDGVLGNLKKYSENEVASFKNQMGFPEDTILLGIIGRLEENKGHIFAVESFAKLQVFHKNARLMIVGAGDADYTTRVMRKIKELGLEKVVSIKGFVEDISEIYAVIDILIQPSIYDNIPFSIIEAFSYKKPVVASNVGGIPEVVENGINGYLVASGNSDGLADKIMTLINSDYKSFGENGFNTVNKKFSKERMLNNYINLTERVLEK